MQKGMESQMEEIQIHLVQVKYIQQNFCETQEPGDSDEGTNASLMQMAPCPEKG